MTTVNVRVQKASGDEVLVEDVALPLSFALEESGTEPPPEPEPPPDGAHAYFDSLAARPDCLQAWAMRSQEELDSMVTEAPAPRLPVVYDAAADAACFSIDAPVTPDSQQKIIKLEKPDLTYPSVCVTWDFNFDEGFRWHPDEVVDADGVEHGYLGGHKTWRFDCGNVAWLALKTSYKACGVTKPEMGDYIAEWYLSTQAGKYVGTGTTRASDETLHPRYNMPVYFKPNTWTRIWLLFEDLALPECAISLWLAGPETDAVQLYHRLKMIIPPDRMTRFRFEYDSSAPPGINPDLLLSWNRNWIMLQGVTADDMPALLQRPSPVGSTAWAGRRGRRQQHIWALWRAWRAHVEGR